MMDFTGFYGRSVMGSYGTSFLTANPLFFVFAVILVVFWLWMLVDCLNRNFKKDMDKLVWIILLLFIHILGAFLYYFLVKAKK